VLSEFGIPQGSILAPMLFKLYSADLQDILPHTAKSFQYADDTTMYSSCTTPQITSQAESNPGKPAPGQMTHPSPKLFENPHHFYLNSTNGS